MLWAGSSYQNGSLRCGGEIFGGIDYSGINFFSFSVLRIDMYTRYYEYLPLVTLSLVRGSDFIDVYILNEPLVQVVRA